MFQELLCSFMSRGVLEADHEHAQGELHAAPHLSPCRSDLLRHPLPGRNSAKSHRCEQVQCCRVDLFRFEKDACCATLLQQVHACEEQRSPESYLPVGWARPDYPNFTDRVFASAVSHLV